MKTIFRSYGLFLVAALFLLSCGGEIGDLIPFDGEPKEYRPNADERSMIDNGERVFIKNSEEDYGLAIFRVNAPETRVWEVISDFDQYPNMIPEITVAERYKDDEIKDGRRQINIKFQLQKSFLFTITRNYYVVHDFPANNKGWGTWHTDYDKDDENEIYNVGYWRVKPVRGNPNQSEVTYYIKLKLKYGTDNFLRSFIMDNGLRQATQWVTENAEK